MVIRMMPKSMRAGILILLLFGHGALFHSQAQESRGGGFQAIVEKKGGAKNAAETNHWSASVVERTGKEVYRITRDVPFDVQFPAIHVSDVEGRAVVVQPLNGIVEFYDGRGGLVNTMTFSVTNDLDYERILKCSVGAGRVAVLTSERDVDARVIMCTIDGRELWRRTLKGTQAAEILLSATGDVVVVGSYVFADGLQASTEMLDGEGRRLREMSGMFRYADISHDSRRVALAGKNIVTIEAIAEGVASRSYHTASGNHIITGIRYVREHLAVVVELVEFENGIPQYRPSVIILDQNATQVAMKELLVVAPAPATLAITRDTVILRSNSQSVTVEVEKINR